MVRIWLVVLLLCVAAVAGSAVERKDVEDVDQADLVRETQKMLSSSESVNVVWVVPREYWLVSFAQNEAVTEEAAAAMVDALSEFLLVGVVRADISPFGAFEFHKREAVLKKLEATYVDAAGKARVLEVSSSPGNTVETVLEAIKPVLRAAMGNLGTNFHFFLYKDEDGEGRRIVSPYEKGALHVRLEALGKAPAGTLVWEFPLDTLCVPRRCADCAKDMHVSWNYCPWCGKKLP